MSGTAFPNQRMSKSKNQIKERNLETAPELYQDKSMLCVLQERSLSIGDTAMDAVWMDQYYEHNFICPVVFSETSMFLSL